MTIPARALAAALILFSVTAPFTPARAEVQYLINVGDQLELDILDDREPPQQFRVGGDGEIQLPLIGGVRVEGLSISAARATVQRAYVEREIYRDPTVEVSVVQYRQIFVLGDVRTPGAYEFSPFLSAEQALGLAGGPTSAASNEESRILERSRLLGQLNALQTDLARAAVKQGGARAQLSGEGTIRWDAVSKALRAIIEEEAFDLLRIEEERLLTLATRAHTEQIVLQGEAIKKVSYEITLLKQREELESAALERAREQLDLDQGLVERGLSTRASVLDAEGDLADATSDLLRLRETISVAERRLSDLRIQMSQLESTRQQRLLAEVQEQSRVIATLTAQRDSLVDRLALLGQWISAAASGEAEVRILYHVRRRTRDQSIETYTIDAYEELLPGDLLIVTLRPAGTPEEAIQ
ncbi:MAG: polysaccharide biosynthesis/export family protein [Pseudomonadota bacterium]